MYYRTEYHTKLVTVTLASDGEALVGLWLEGQKYFAETVGAMKPEDNLPVFRDTKAWLDRYFEDKRPDPMELPLAPAGSAFRQKVWKLLLEIPYGETITYSQLAAMLGDGRMSAQAVGGAVGHNPISIIIPCHRVIGVRGGLTGYAGGIENKRWLLQHEGVNVKNLTMPK